jgi:hypothetical protein
MSHYLHTPHVVTVICLLSEVFMLLAYNSSLGLMAPDKTSLVSLLTIVAVKVGWIAFILRQVSILLS